MQLTNDKSALTEATYFILLALTRPRHGYAIMQFVSEITQRRVNLGAGTLYGALSTLIEKGWIEQLPENSMDRKKEYYLSEDGVQILLSEIERLKSIAAIGDKLIREVDNYDDKNS